jgi:hypothetical protein
VVLAAGGQDVPAEAVELVEEQRFEMLAVKSISPRFHFQRDGISFVLFGGDLEVHRRLLQTLRTLRKLPA